MRLNVCCGGRILDDYKNIDIAAAKDKTPPDIIADARRIPLESGCADEIMCIHGFEHFYRWEVDALAVEWLRLLKSGGLLVLEMPDLIKCCENVLRDLKGDKHDDQMGMWGLYGDDRLKNPYMVHRWAWSPKSLRVFLKGHGFIEIIDAETKFHPVGRARRDMRIEAKKP